MIGRGAIPPPEPGERRSAWLDGELEAAEAAALQEELDGDPAAAADLASLGAVRDLVRSLPPVEPPEGAIEAAIGVAARDPFGRFHVRVGVNLVATAAAWAAVLGLAQLDRSDASGPALASFVDRHAGTEAAAVVVPSAVPQVGADLGLPAGLGDGYELAAVLQEGSRHQAIYVHDQQVLSVFVAPGELDEAALPGGSWRVADHDDAWMVPARAPGGAVLVAERHDATLVAVGAEAEAAADWLAGVDPDMGDETVLDRVVAAGQGLLRTFALG